MSNQPTALPGFAGGSVNEWPGWRAARGVPCRAAVMSGGPCNRGCAARQGMHAGDFSRTLLITVLALSCSSSVASRFPKDSGDVSDQEQSGRIAQGFLNDPALQEFILKQTTSSLTREMSQLSLGEKEKDPNFYGMNIDEHPWSPPIPRVSRPSQAMAQQLLGAENSPISIIPNEVGQEIMGWVGLKDYLAMLQTFKGAREMFRLPFEEEVALLEREFDNDLAIKLISLWTSDVMSASADDQEDKEVICGKLLKVLVDLLFVEPELGEDVALDARRLGLVGNKTLDAKVWGGYADVVMEEVVNEIVSKEDAANRFWVVVAAAAKTGSIDAIRGILSKVEEKGIKVDLAAGDNLVIRWASYYEHVEVVRLLLEKKESEDAAKFGYDEIDPAAVGNDAIMEASSNGHVKVVKLLLEKKESEDAAKFGYNKIDPAACDNYAIRLASENGHVEVVRLLLAKKESKDAAKFGYDRIDPSAEDNKAIKRASRNGYVEVVKLLLAKKESEDAAKFGYDNINPAAEDNEAIRYASYYGHVEVVRLLLEKKESKDADKFGYDKIDPADLNNEAIRQASWDGHVEVVKLLLEKRESDDAAKFGYDMIDPAAHNNLAIKWASQEGHVEVVKLLLAKKEARPDLYGGIRL